MYCHNCRKELVGTGKYCQSCGTKQDDVSEKTYDKALSGKGSSHPMESVNKLPQKLKLNSKTLKIVTLFVAAVIILGSVILIVINILPDPQKELSVAELLDLGERYLLEHEYELALMQFMGVIEIEPRNQRGYSGAAEVYIGLGDKDSAILILELGLKALPGNTELQALLYKLLPPEPATSGVTTPANDDSPSLPTDTTDDVILAAYRAYYKLLSTAIEEHGIGRFERVEYETIINGIVYAELIDFDNDGVVELLYIYGNNEVFASATCVIYRYSEGSIELLESYDVNHFHMNINVGSAHNGTSFLCYMDYADFWLYDTFFSIVNKKWGEVLSLELNVIGIYDDDQNWLGDEFEWFVNGNSVTEQEYYDSLNTYIGNGDVRTINILEDNTATIDTVLTFLNDGISNLLKS